MTEAPTKTMPLYSINIEHVVFNTYVYCNTQTGHIGVSVARTPSNLPISNDKKNYRKNYRKQYCIDNKAEVSLNCKQYYKDNIERLKRYGREYYTSHKEECSTRAKQYYERTRDPDAPRPGSKEYSIKMSCIQRDMDIEDFDGFSNRARTHVLPVRKCIKINDWFKGSHAHHITKSIIIYIPKELHQHISHNLKSGHNMAEMNMLALQFVNGEM